MCRSDVLLSSIGIGSGIWFPSYILTLKSINLLNPTKFRCCVMSNVLDVEFELSYLTGCFLYTSQKEDVGEK